MKIQLTISLLVSDRMETLGRCLASLKPLLRELDSELIIVYTGKSPETLELARRYTAHIIPFTWCNDFAKARNEGLKAARGEWFIYLDDDEWFEDTSEIVGFFKSGEYERYRSAFYIQRNYLDWEGNAYSDAYVGRMCRRTRDTEFIYPIHENLMPFHEPCKKFAAYVHHFGYVGSKDEEKQSNKSDRNLSLLLERLKTERASSHLYAQLAQEYAGLREYDTAIRYCRKGLELAGKERESDALETWLAMKLPLYLSYHDEVGAAIDEGEAILASHRLKEVGEINLAAALVNFCWRRKEYRKCLEYVCFYRDRLEYLWKYPEKAMEQSGITETFSTAEAENASVCVKGLFSALEIKDTGKAEQILAWLPWEDEVRITGRYEDLDNWKKQYRVQEERILGAYNRLKAENIYVNLQKAYYAEEQGRTEDLADLWEKCAKSYTESCPESIRAQLIEMAVRNGLGMNVLLKQISLEAWNGCAQMLADRIGISEMQEFGEKIRQELEAYPLLMERLRQCFLEKQLTRGMLESSHLASLLSDYCVSVIADAEMVYRDEILEDLESYVLPAKYKFAVFVKEALRMIENGELSDCVPLISEALHICPQMSIAVSHLTRYLEERMTELSQTVSEEFVVLGNQVKQVLTGLIGHGQWAEAYGVVQQLMALLPEDVEVLKMKQEIVGHVAD